MLAEAPLPTGTLHLLKQPWLRARRRLARMLYRRGRTISSCDVIRVAELSGSRTPRRMAVITNEQVEVLVRPYRCQLPSLSTSAMITSAEASGVSPHLICGREVDGMVNVKEISKAVENATAFRRCTLQPRGQDFPRLLILAKDALVYHGTCSNVAASMVARSSACASTMCSGTRAKLLHSCRGAAAAMRATDHVIARRRAIPG